MLSPFQTAAGFTNRDPCSPLLSTLCLPYSNSLSLTPTPSQRIPQLLSHFTLFYSWKWLIVTKNLLRSCINIQTILTFFFPSTLQSQMNVKRAITGGDLKHVSKNSCLRKICPQIPSSIYFEIFLFSIFLRLCGSKTHGRTQF